MRQRRVAGEDAADANAARDGDVAEASPSSRTSASGGFAEVARSLFGRADASLFRDWRTAAFASKEDSDAFGRWRKSSLAVLDDANTAVVFILLTTVVYFDFVKHPVAALTPHLQTNLLCFWVVNVVVLVVMMWHAHFRTGSYELRKKLVAAYLVVSFLTVNSLIFHMFALGDRPVPAKYRMVFGAFFTMNSQLAWGTPGTADSPLWFALPRSFVLVPLFYLRYGIFFRWHGYGPYRCNVVGVCAPLPGPNELGFIATWPGVFVDVFVLTFVMVLAECKLALSWRLWRAQLSRESNAGVLPGGARRASD